MSDLVVRIGDLVEICEGSWMGWAGVVTALADERHVFVALGESDEPVRVVACTLTKL